MTPEQLQEIEDRAAKAMRGPWSTFKFDDEEIWITFPGDGFSSLAAVRNGSDDEYYGGIEVKDSNADFIAASRTDIPLLCSALREAWEKIEKLEGKNHDRT